MPLSPTQQKKLQRLALALDGKEVGVLTVLEQVENALEAKIEGIEEQLPANYTGSEFTNRTLQRWTGSAWEQVSVV